MAMMLTEKADLRRIGFTETPRVCDHTGPLFIVLRDAFSEGGHLVAKLIAERKFGRTAPSHQNKLDRLAQRLSTYEGILPEPLNTSRKLNITRLIASIDRGMYN